VLAVDPDEYKQNVQSVVAFLQGKRTELVQQLADKMRIAAESLEFERAARYRDQMRAVEGSLEPQQVVLGREVDQDVFGLHREGGWLEIAVLFVRRGRMVGSRTFGFDEQAIPDAEVLSTFCNLFYHGGNSVPDEVLLPVEPDAEVALVDRLSELMGRRVEVRAPQRGAGKRLVEMAARNAEQSFIQARRSDAVRNGALVALKKRLRLANLPNRIECYDISLFQGASPVASRVVFEGGVPMRSAYRHYRIREVEGTDDFAMMREVLTRRLKRGLAEGDLPDLIVVDGGKGQLGVALAVFEDLGIQGVDLVGLAKSRVLEGETDEGASRRSPERVFVPGAKDPIPLRAHTDELFLMTRLRDEAHRFAITFHRKLRTGRNFESALDAIPGVGPTRKKALLQAFGSLKKLREASEAEIAAVPGIGERLAHELATALAR
jgi:excinuclease ABC subunit C